MRNSWGKNWCDSGYFWVSYADGTFPQYVTYFDGAKPFDDTLHVYETDYKSQGTTYSAGSVSKNYYVRAFQTNGIEALQSVRVFVPDANCRVSVDCIPDFSYYSAGQSGKYNFEGYSAFTSRGTVSSTYPGWYTIDLTTPVLLEAKKDFAVVICVENLNGGTARMGHDMSSQLTDSVSFLATDAQFSSNGIWTSSSLNSSIKAVTNTAVPHENHVWGQPTYAWTSDNSKVTATRTCKHDASHVESETVNTTSAVTKAATCVEDGQTIYTAAFTNSAFAEQSKTVTINALGHDWNVPTYTWSDNDHTCTAERVCDFDGCCTSESETVRIVALVRKANASPNSGQATFYMTFKNPAFETQVKTVKLNP